MKSALVFLTLLASASAIVISNPTAFCSASPPSTTSINCYEATTLTNVPSFTGVCTCTCGATAGAAVEIAGGALVAASSAACNAAFCAAASPSTCNVNSGYIGASYQSASAYLAGAQMATTSVVAGTSAQCFSYVETCTSTGAAAGNCDTAIIGATITASYFWNPTTGTCLQVANNAAQAALITSISICNSNNCNSPPSTPSGASSSAAFVAALGLTAVAAILF